MFDVLEEDDGSVLIVMELVDAPTLAELVALQGPLAPRRVAAIGVDLLDTLVAAHEAGIVHRRVNPGNVMVSESGRVRLSDFGVAAVLVDPPPPTTESPAGSSSFAAPEQDSGGSVGAASDIWSLGATLYFAVEGRPPVDHGAGLTTTKPVSRAGPMGSVLEAVLVTSPADRPSSYTLRRMLARVAGGSAAVGDDRTAPFEPADLGGRDRDNADTADLQAVAVPPQPDVPTPPVIPKPVEPMPGAAAELETIAPAVPKPAPHVEPEVVPRVAPEVVPPERPVVSDRRRPLLVVAGVAVVALLAALVVALLAALVVALVGDRSPSVSPTPPQAGAVDAQASTDAAVPGDWVAYSDPATGFTISHPPGWTIRRNGTLTDFVDPDSGAYMRVDHTDDPGPSPEGDWYDLEKRFAATNENYQRNRITPTTYAGFPAAIWEFTYSAGGASLHASDLGFVTPTHGFALYAQSRVEDWDGMQPVFAAFRAAFRAPA